MIALRRAAPATVAALTTGLLLVAGCGTTATPAPAPTASPTATTPAVPDPTQAAAGPVELPWPAPSPADADALQMGVDSGSQPWLLDPPEVALSYVAAAHSWTDATTTGDGAIVTVRNTDGQQVILTLAQPVRTGPAGIWVVTAERPAPA